MFGGVAVGKLNGVDRVLGFFSIRPNWDPPPHPQASVPPLGSGGGGGHTRLGNRGWGPGVSSFDEVTDTAVL